MSKLFLGLNLPKKPALSSRPPPAKRKTLFDDDDDDDDSIPKSNQPPTNVASTFESITTLDSTPHSTSPPPSSSDTKPSFSIPKAKSTPLSPPAPPKKLTQPPLDSTENLSTKQTSAKHAQKASEIDPTIYDYDGIYDAMKASTAKPTTTDATDAKPKYMSALKAAAEVRKRDAVRAADRKTAREREAEGDEFVDKEQFVTGAYRRQQEELRRAEEEEARREEKEMERRKEGKGMGEWHRRELERGERVHEAVLRAVEERKGMVDPPGEGGEVEGEGERKEKSEEEKAREAGVEVNEEGEVVDKRELLRAGLNAGGAAKKVVKKEGADGREKGGRGGRRETQREKVSRELEEQLLGKHGLTDDDEEGGGASARASKSRKMEDELLAGFGSP